ncbi:MAG: RnfH family protein, partial [Pseudomonadota bacterium]
MPTDTIRVEVAWALPDRQVIEVLEVSPGTTARQAAERVFERVPPPHSLSDIGVFGRRMDGDHVLRANDRVEFYRPLSQDPKVVRRKLARLAKDSEKG